MSEARRSRIEARPFRAADLDACAALLAARHRADRAREPALPARFERPNDAGRALAAALHGPRTEALVAVRDRRTAGFLVGGVVLVPPQSRGALYAPPRAGWAGYAGHAAAPGAEGAVYRALYGELATRWLAAGCSSHFVDLPSGDRAALTAWRSLGFGLEQQRGVRGTDAEPVPPPAGVELRRGGTADLDLVMRLAEAMSRHHAESPTFLPYLHEALTATRDEHARLLADPLTAYWLALRDGEPLGMQVFTPAPPADPYTPDSGVHLQDVYATPAGRGGRVTAALLARGLAWAREAGFEWCSASWRTANLPAHRTWVRAGFRPVRAMLRRLVDERALWARA